MKRDTTGPYDLLTAMINSEGNTVSILKMYHLINIYHAIAFSFQVSFLRRAEIKSDLNVILMHFHNEDT